MSVKVLSRVLGHFHPDSDVGDRLVLLVVADAAHDDGITWISQTEIAAKALLSERHVRRCLKELEQRGELESRKAQRGRRRISVYRVLCAPNQPDYDRLPFDLSIPFSTTGQGVRPSNGDDRTSDVVTTGLPRSESAVVPSIGTVSRTVNPIGEVPKLTKVGGRNLSFDALATVCSVPLANRVRVAQMTEALRDIRAYFAAERPEVAAAGGEQFERQLEGEIVRRARLYRERWSPGTTLTPPALAKWWHDCAPDAKGERFGDIDRV